MKNSNSIATTQHSSVAFLLGLESETDQRSPEAKQEALEHLISIPIEIGLNRLPSALGDKLRRRGAELEVVSRARETGINTFGDLLNHRHPPIEMLKFAKEFGKAIVHSGKTVWPVEVGQALNYAAYAAAFVCWRERLGTLSKADLEKGFRKLAARDWIPPNLRELFTKAAGKLSAAADQ